MILKSNRIFYFSKKGGLAYVHLSKSHSNIFVTLTDLKKRLLVCVTSGSSGIIGSKRQKKAPMALENIVKKCLPVFEKYRINSIKIILRSRISSLYYSLCKELKFHGFKIVGVIVRRKMAFNGVRRRKLRRV